MARQGRGRPPGGRSRRPGQGRRPHPGDRRRAPRHKVTMVVRGLASEVGLDGNLRVNLDPITLELARELRSRGGARVFEPRGEELGRLTNLVGSLERPIAVVKLDPDARKLATSLRGRELYLG